MKELNVLLTLLCVFHAMGCDGEGGPCTPTNGGIEACNDGLDNDCDGQIDEDCSMCTPTNGGVEQCEDNIDNDCDGQIDEGCTSSGCIDGETRGCGGSPAANVCQERCSGGTWGLCLPIGSSEEICGDSIDNNCNGSIDEYCSAEECEGTETEECGGSPGSNLCQRTCQAGRWSECAPRPPNTGEEICDGLDNSCDGVIDEGDCSCESGETMWCGATPERHSCNQVCEGGRWSGCQPVSGRDEEEACGDGEDNDCDNRIDEPEPCTISGCGDGEARCQGTTRGDCFNEDWDCAPGDEVNEACPGETEGICDPGVRSRTCSATCTWSTWGACEDVVSATTESCNGLDDDCDGTVDDNVSGSDSYGSNSSQGSCYDLGEDPEERTLYPLLEANGEDWFCFDGHDGSFIGWESIDITLTNLPGDLDVFLYRDNPETGAFEELASSVAGGSSDEEISWGENFGGEDTSTYYIKVDSFYSSLACYTLYIDGLR